MIQHALASQDGQILPILQSDLSVDPERGRWLCEFGAVYVQHQRCRNFNQEVKKGDYLRVHGNPRRFPVEVTDWKACIITETPEFVIIDKPCGVPTHANVDNLYENAAHQVSVAINHPTHVTHRLDVATSGILFLAKTKEMQRQFNIGLRDGLVHKTYLAKVAGQFSRTGLIQHFMEASNYLPKKISADVIEGWQQCLLEILQTKTDLETTEVEIRLITGRTHQIRAQMAALGHPVIGDKIYGGQDPWDKVEKISLRARSLKFKLGNLPEFYFSTKD